MPLFMNAEISKAIMTKSRLWKRFLKKKINERRNLNHGHKKRKGSLEVCLVQVVFAAELEVLKILVPRLPQNTSNVNIKSTKKPKQQYYLCLFM